MDVFHYLAPGNYEMEEWSRPDEMALFGAFWERAQAELDTIAEAEIADLCCGTGMSLLGVISHPNIKTVTGVDIDARNIAFARQRFGIFENATFQVADVTDFLKAEKEYDLLLLSSAYHHIEHSLQPAFARQLFGALKPGGRAVFAENIVPYFDAPLTEPYNTAVVQFYAAARDDTRRRRPNISDRIIRLIEENVSLAIRGEVEFKVCRQHFLSQLQQAGFEMVHEARAWPAGEPLPDNSGNHVFVFRKPDAA